MIAPEILTGGFADPVFQSQSVFRSVLDALARPGRVVPIARFVTAPAPLYPSTAALLCALADETTPVLMEGVPSSGAAAAWIGFHTGAKGAARPDLAAFAIVTNAREMPDIGGFALGTQDYPDRSTTVIVQVESLASGEALQLEGPGVDGAAAACVTPLPPDFTARLARNRALFPRGIDMILAAPDAILALPRTTIVTPLRRD